MGHVAHYAPKPGASKTRFEEGEIWKVQKTFGNGVTTTKTGPLVWNSFVGRLTLGEATVSYYVQLEWALTKIADAPMPALPTEPGTVIRLKNGRLYELRKGGPHYGGLQSVQNGGTWFGLTEYWLTTPEVENVAREAGGFVELVEKD